MKIHEYQAMELFKKAGIPVAGGRVTTEVSEAVTIAREIGYPAVLKSQVLVGGRGKAGGIKVVKNQEELEKTFKELKNLKIKGYAVDRILVTRAIEIDKEFYSAVTIDPAHNDAVLIASAAGGIDIEETARTHPEKIQKYYLQRKKDIDPGRWKSFIQAVFPSDPDSENATQIMKKLLNAFFANDCSLAEINPLVIDKQGKWFAADAKINVDDNALFRHPELAPLQDFQYEDPDEIEAKQHDLSFVKLEGDIGCIVNGAGLAMATVDIIQLVGGRPANFLDVGGSSSPEKVLWALKIILRNPRVRAILINIFGGITRCDDIALGILEARKQLEIRASLVVRLTGTNEEKAKELLAKEKINTYPTMREAVKRVVDLVK